MPDNTNPQAVKFANERVRVIGDAYVTLYESAKKFEAEYAANSLDAVFLDTLDAVADGAAVDGRSIINNRTVRGLRTQNNQVIAWFEAVPSGATISRIAMLRQIAVNGASRF